MAEKESRYSYVGFTYGDDGCSVLQIQTKKVAGFSDWLTRIEFDLTNAERLELIDFLVKLPLGEDK